MSKIILDENKIPTHVAIIMDGNGRWAKRRGMPRNFGHQKGAHNLTNIIEACMEIGIKVLTVYAFSTENWTRPQKEVDYLMSLALEFFENNRKDAKKKDIKIKIIGEKDNLHIDLVDKIKLLEDETQNNQAFTFVVALNYGSHVEMIHAIKQISNLVSEKQIKTSEITTQLVEQHLYTKDLPPVDLLIRTSGEERISNFLLWQIAYSEIYFTKKLWPDFHKSELKKAVQDYQSRNRRFGRVEE